MGTETNWTWEPPLEAIFSEPIVRLVMASDQVDPDNLRRELKKPATDPLTIMEYQRGTG